MPRPVVSSLALASLLALSATGATHASPYSVINAAAAAGPITVHHVRGAVSMLDGSGGEMTVLSGPKGVLMVDAGIAVSQTKIRGALKSLNPGPLRCVILTHWHWDHSDGDGWVRRAGATIVADKASVERLKQTNRIVEWEHTFTPVAKASLPNVIITRDTTMHFGGETLRVRLYKPGHTDDDLSVYFEKADVLSTGDTFWNGVFPFIDYVTGGSIDGAIQAANENLKLAKSTTLVVPGHGPAGDRSQLVAFRDMLVKVRDRVASLKAKGMSVDEVVAAKPTAEFDPQWGRSVINGDLFTRLVYRGV